MDALDIADYRIVSGGQTGVDRAALDTAIELAAEYGGWCPRGGWAEDLVSPPGLLTLYPNMRETPLADVRQRTEWNVRDSDVTLILLRGLNLAVFPGTQLTREMAVKLGRRHLILDLQRADSLAHAKAWLNALGDDTVLNVAGPRESEAPGIYAEAKAFLKALFR